MLNRYDFEAIKQSIMEKDFAAYLDKKGKKVKDLRPLIQNKQIKQQQMQIIHKLEELQQRQLHKQQQLKLQHQKLQHQRHSLINYNTVRDAKIQPIILQD